MIAIIKSFFFALVLFSTFQSFAGSFAMRAREHFEIHDLDIGEQSLKYTGLSNTINLWYEVPFKYSIGLSFSPILAKMYIDDKSASSLLGEDIKIYNVGTEYKQFLNFLNRDQFYTRLGISWIKLRSYGTHPDSNGLGIYVGGGYEFKYKRVGIAPEIAFRYGVLERGDSLLSFVPSVGVHFYKLF